MKITINRAVSTDPYWYYIDAYVYMLVPAQSYAVSFELRSPAPGTTTNYISLGNSTYLTIPGFNVPPGYVLGTTSASLSIETCSPNAPSSVNLYWGPFYIGAVNGVKNAYGCTTYVVVPTNFRGALDVAAISSLYLGETIHGIYIGPFPPGVLSSGLKINEAVVRGYYRPDINNRSSSIFGTYALSWGYYTQSLFGFGTTLDGFYYVGTKLEIKIYRSGGDVSPTVEIPIMAYQNMFQCGRISIWLSAKNQSGSSVTLSLRSSNEYIEGSGLFDLGECTFRTNSQRLRYAQNSI